MVIYTYMIYIYIHIHRHICHINDAIHFAVVFSNDHRTLGGATGAVRHSKLQLWGAALPISRNSAKLFDAHAGERLHRASPGFTMSLLQFLRSKKKKLGAI